MKHLPNKVNAEQFDKRVSYPHVILKKIFFIMLDLIFFLPLLIMVLLVRVVNLKKNKIGIGPTPSINAKGHKKALEFYNYNVETFVDNLWYYTQEFDKIPPKIFLKYDILRGLYAYYLFVYIIFNYNVIYIYFTGGALRNSRFLYSLEPLFYNIAKVKVVVLPYGMDVQDQRITSNLIYKDGYINDYPDFRFYNIETSKKIQLWQNSANFVLSGCDWIKYMFYWDDILISHFAIDTKEKISERKRNYSFSKKKPLKILHAPNHTNLKGTEFLKEVVKKLKKNGFYVDLSIIQGVDNSKMPDFIRNADIIVDQLIIGWYAYLSIEGMREGVPVMCYLEEDLIKFYKYKGVLKDDIPIININLDNLYKMIEKVYQNPKKLKVIGKKSVDYIKKYHSYEYIGKKFDEINTLIGVKNE